MDKAINVSDGKNKTTKELVELFAQQYYREAFPDSDYQTEVINGVRVRFGEVNICQTAPNEAVNPKRVRELFADELFKQVTESNPEPALVPPVFAPYMDKNTNRQSMLIDGNNRTVALLCLQYLSHFGVGNAQSLATNVQTLIDTNILHPKWKRTIVACMKVMSNDAKSKRQEIKDHYTSITKINVIGAHAVEEFWPNINVLESEAQQIIVLNNPDMLRTYTQDPENTVPPK
jgi:hypothetical protein